MCFPYRLTRDCHLCFTLWSYISYPLLIIFLMRSLNTCYRLHRSLITSAWLDNCYTTDHINPILPYKQVGTYDILRLYTISLILFVDLLSYLWGYSDIVIALALNDLVMKIAIFKFSMWKKSAKGISKFWFYVYVKAIISHNSEIIKNDCHFVNHNVQNGTRNWSHFSITA